MLFEVFEHRGERGPARLLGRLHIDELFGDNQTILQCVVPQQALLCRNGVTLLLLILDALANARTPMEEKGLPALPVGVMG
jgi:hypothetical protein